MTAVADEVDLHCLEASTNSIHNSLHSDMPCLNVVIISVHASLLTSQPTTLLFTHHVLKLCPADPSGHHHPLTCSLGAKSVNASPLLSIRPVSAARCTSAAKLCSCLAGSSNAPSTLLREPDHSHIVSTHIHQHTMLEQTA